MHSADLYDSGLIDVVAFLKSKENKYSVENLVLLAYIWGIQ